MSSGGSVTSWIHEFREGNYAVAQPLWERYFERLMQLARQRLNGVPKRVADEEDVALSAFHALCEGLAEDRFPRLTDRDDLWRLLVVLTARKATRFAVHERRMKRGGGRVYCETDLLHVISDDETPFLAEMIGPEPTPEFAAEVAEQVQALMNALPEPDLRRIAQWRMAGQTVREIAKMLGRAPRTVERKLQRIRTIWIEEVE